MERICLIILFNFLFFFKTLSYKFSSDDIPAFRKPPPTRNEWERRLFQLEGRLRVDHHQDHFLTMLIHTAVCVFIYTGFGSTDISFLAAFLFAFNPANNQGSVWISGRSYALPALGMTVAMTIPVIGPLCLLGSTYFNAGFTAPLVYLGSQHIWMLLFLPFIWLFHWRRFKRNVLLKINQELFTEDKRIHWRKGVLFTKTFGFYVVHALIPFKNTFYHSFLQSAAGSMKDRARSMKDRFFWIGLIAGPTMIYYIYTLWGSQIAFGLLWWCVCIAPFCNLVRIHQEIAERYMYLPNVGLMIVLATILQGHPIAIACFITGYATKMWFYMDAFTDDYYLIEQACLNSPDSWFAWHVRAMKRWDSGSRQEAVILWTMARMISPNEFKLNFNIAAALRLTTNKKFHEEADQFLARAEAHIPGGQEEQAGKLIEEFRKGQVTILL
jgi:hypothetical protein